MDKTEHLFTLYQLALQPDTVNRATTELIHLYDNPETVFDHIFFVDHCDNLLIRRYVILKLPTLIKEHLSNFSDEQIEGIKDSITRLILQEEDLNSRYFLCDALISIIKKYTKFLINNSDEDENILPHFSQIFDFANEIIKLPNYLSTGIYMWRNIFLYFQEFDLSTDDEDDDSNLILELLFMLLEIIPLSLASENEEDRLQALQLVEIMHIFLVDIETLNEHQSILIESLFQSLLQEFEVSLNSDNIELSHCCSAIACFIETPPCFVDESILSSFFELTIAILSDENFSIEKGYIVHTILESSVDLIANDENCRSEISNLINISVTMSINICQQDRTDANYEFPFRFFYLLSDAFNDSESNGVAIFDLFLTFATNLAENEAINQNFEGRQVSLFIIKSIIESLQEIISMKIDDVVHFIIQNGDIDDEYVLNSACQTIDELFECVSSSASKYIDEISEYLCKYACYPTSIRTLDSVFYRSDNPPTDIEIIFKGLTEMISIESSNDQIESLLSCITSLFSRISTTEEEILSTFLPFINQIIDSPSHFDLHPAVLDFFGRIVTIAPLTIKNELSTLVPLAVDSFSMENFELSIAASNCLRSVSKTLPLSFSPYLEQVIPPLIAILQESGADQDPEQEQENESIEKVDNEGIEKVESDEIEISNNGFNGVDFDADLMFAKAQREAMLTLATFVGFMPTEMAEYAQSPILDFILGEKGGLHRYLVHACESLAYASEGYKVLGVGIYEVLGRLLPLLFESKTAKDEVFSILMLASEIVAVFGDVMSDDFIDLTITSLINILSSPPPIFLLTDSSSSSIDPQIQTPLFFLFSQMIDMFNESKFESFFGRICELFLSYINNDGKSVILRCNAILASAHLIASCPSLFSESDTFCQIVLNAAIQVMMSSQSSEANILIAKSVKYLVIHDKNLLKQRLPMLIEFSADILENCGYFGLFCTLLMAYNEIIELKDHFDKILKFVEFLPPPPDSEEVVFYSEFVAFLLNGGLELEELEMKLPEVALSLFASSDKHFESASPETKTIFASIIVKLSEEDLIALNKANESKLIRINDHMKLLSE